MASDTNVRMLKGAMFLTDTQIWGDTQGNGQLEVMKHYGTRCGMSDLAILLGGYKSNKYKTRDGQFAGSVWSASSSDYGYVRAVSDNGDWNYSIPNKRYCGARPALPSSITSAIRTSVASSSKKICNDSVEVVEYGEYPQTVAGSVAAELESAFLEQNLKTTGKQYKFYARRPSDYSEPFKPKKCEEYAYTGADGITRKYIRVIAQPADNESILSNGDRVREGQAYWVEVQPIEWLVEPEGSKNAGMLIARQALFSGVPFDNKERYDGNFAKTSMHEYLKDNFLPEIQPSQVVVMAPPANAEINPGMEPLPTSTPSSAHEQPPAAEPATDARGFRKRVREALKDEAWRTAAGKGRQAGRPGFERS